MEKCLYARDNETAILGGAASRSRIHALRTYSIQQPKSAALPRVGALDLSTGPLSSLSQ